MRRGRLIFPVLAEISPFVGAPLQDPDFKEPALVASGETGPGTDAPREGTVYRLPCQVEPDEVGAVNMQANGDAPRSQVNLVFHSHQLRGHRRPQVRDRLVALYSGRGQLIVSFPDPPGMFATEVRPLSFGLRRGNSEANLLRVPFRDRARGVRRPA